jgi:hypothetical protein
MFLLRSTQRFPQELSHDMNEQVYSARNHPMQFLMPETCSLTPDLEILNSLGCVCRIGERGSLRQEFGT